MKTSKDLITKAIAEGRAVVHLPDGDVHICDLTQHTFPDVVCNAAGCGKAFDSRLTHMPLLDRWKNGNAAAAIQHRDNWRNNI